MESDATSRHSPVSSDRWVLKNVGIQIYNSALSISGDSGRGGDCAEMFRRSTETTTDKKRRNSMSNPLVDWHTE